MPRRDGFPTNPELLADFTAHAQQVFVQAYETDLQNDLPPSYEGKSLGHLRLNIVGTSGYLATKAVTTEKMTISTINPLTVEGFQEHLRLKDYPADVLAYYATTAERLGSTALMPGLQLADTVPVEGIDAAYVATLKTGQRRHVSTFKEKPSKQSIVSAVYFAEEVLASMAAGDSPRPGPDDLLGHVMSTSETPLMSRYYTFEITPELHLNGYESETFLLAYYDRMVSWAEHVQARAERLQRSGAPQIIVDMSLERYDAYSKAITNALRALKAHG